LSKTSLIIQFLSIVLLFLLTITFHYRCWRAGINRNTKSFWRPIVILYISMTFMLYPTEFRLIALFVEESPFRKYEWYLYVCVGLPMLMNEVMRNVWHPGHYLPNDGAVVLGEE
ncbi:hypothetical protein BDV96DRAFT_451904, partial [Lophiotrema nucula]